jgi:large subunit ribosomal protein L29
MAKPKEIKDLSVAELSASDRELAREIFTLRSELSVNRKLEKPHLLKMKRKERARVLTFLKQKANVQGTV